MNKRERQQKVLSLIRAKPISKQEELKAMLERAGVPATQSSVSRDLEELGIVKHHGVYTLPQTNGAAARGLLSLDNRRRRHDLHRGERTKSATGDY